jgi:predicted RNA-binding protein with TRAM domain
VVKLETTRDLWSVANKWGIDYISVDGSFDQNYNGSALPPDTTPPEPEPELTMPTQVKNVRIEDITSTSATISWDLNSENVLKYIVYLNGEKYGEITGTEYTISDLQPNTTYEVTVTAINEAGEGPASEPLIFTTPELPPEPATKVKNVVIKNMTSTSATISWTPNPEAEKITKYIIYLNGEKYGETEDTEYVIEGLKKGEKYVVTVTAVNDLGEGPASEPITFTTSKIADISNTIKVQDILSSIAVLFTNLWPLLAFALALIAIVPITTTLKHSFRRRSDA